MNSSIELRESSAYNEDLSISAGFLIGVILLFELQNYKVKSKSSENKNKVFATES
jgi:hypothetical protein